MDEPRDADVETARQALTHLSWTLSAYERDELTQLITAHTEATLVADRLARHDETVAAIEAARDEERRPAVIFAKEINSLTARLAAAEAYADKLATGLPDGMLPKDVELLKAGNAALATENERLKAAVMEKDEECKRLRARTEEQAAELLALREESERPKCLYCAFGEARKETFEALQAHIENECQRHPIRDLTARLAAAERTITDNGHKFQARVSQLQARLAAVKGKANQELTGNAYHDVEILTARLALSEQAIVERDRMTDEAITYWKDRLAAADKRTDDLEAERADLRRDLNMTRIKGN